MDFHGAFSSIFSNLFAKSFGSFAQQLACKFAWQSVFNGVKNRDLGY